MTKNLHSQEYEIEATMAPNKKCPSCDSTEVRIEQPREFNYDRIGLSGVSLAGNGVTIFNCNNCKNKTTVIRQEQQLTQVIGISILVNGPGITGEQVRYLRTLFGSTQKDFADAIGKRRPTIAEWEAKGIKPVFGKPFDEIGLRLFLMHQFTDKVLESDYCFLSVQQEKEFSDFAGSFVENLQKILDKNKRPKKITINRPRRSQNWQTVQCLSG